MKTGLIQPCVNQIPEKVTYETLSELLNHMIDEYGEVNDAWDEWTTQRNGKTLAHLSEELTDLATMCMTMLEAIEVLPENDHITEYANNVLMMVASKNYARGYHNKPMI